MAGSENTKTRGRTVPGGFSQSSECRFDSGPRLVFVGQD